MTKQIIPIPWKNFPVTVTGEQIKALFLDFSCGLYTPSFIPREATHWCTRTEWDKAVQSMLPEPPLPEIIRPKLLTWTGKTTFRTVDFGGTWYVYAENLDCLSSKDAYYLHGPSGKTEREAIEAWNELVK